ncbi:MAG: hypothetical protein HZC16_02305, partial [Candidatus Omnitrophica bacterium]|nr:hypothetical protein [Candidatus Omnitrophota bacterium]
ILVRIFCLKWGLELGAEFFPTDTRKLTLGYPLILIGLILLVAAGTSSENKFKTATKIWLGITGFFFIFSFFFWCYLIHTYPLVLVALAAYLSDWWQGCPRLWLVREIPAIKVGLWAAIILMLALLGVHTGKTFRQASLAEMYYNRHYEQVAKFMAQQIPVGEVVFHTNWSDSQYFIGLNPQNDYFVTLDPIYMYAWNTRIYNLYRDIAFGRSSDPYNLLKKVFHAHYGYAGKNYFSGLITQIRADSRFAVMAEDNLGLVFRLK